MKIGLVGLPGSGKTTCFRVLSGRHHADTHHGSTVATVPLPDPRLDEIARLEKPRTHTYADVTFVDFEALRANRPSGKELALHTVSGDVDAFALVVQCFGSVDREGNPFDPADDLDTLMLAMVLSDLAIIEKHLENLNKGPKAERTPQRMDLMRRCRDQLSAGKPLRQLRFTSEERRYLSGFRPLSLMPILVVCNVAEDDLKGAKASSTVKGASALGLPHLILCAELEEELAQLSADEQQAFLEDYGLEGAARDRFVQACFALLDLLVFYTVNQAEARGWTLRRGSTAYEAAGRVHSDLQAGFIRAEITPFGALAKCGALHACKEKGFTRVEGKDYLVQDGDVLQVRFSR